MRVLRYVPAFGSVTHTPTHAASRAQTDVPKILLVSVLPYLFSAKLVLGLEKSGFAVAVLCPSGHHPVHHLRNPPQRYPLGIAGANSFGPLGATARAKRALLQFLPDVVIPCDDYAAQIVHRIAYDCAPRTRHLIEQSLGPVDTYPILESRTAQVELARRCHVRVPSAKLIENERGLRQALNTIGLPAFMKRDDSWAGQGVRKIADPAGAQDAWRELSKQHSLAHALQSVRRLGVRHALAGVRNQRPRIHLQAAVAGKPANRTVLCRQGEVVGGFSVVAVRASSETGPASVVQVIDHPEISAAANVLALELRLCGLVGFDFVLDSSGAAYFLEINARATPAATLAISGSPDLLGLLFQTVTASSGTTNRAVDAETIALFPDEMLRDERSPFLSSGYHDIPTDEPGLVEFGLDQARTRRS